jgi:hypothetical protein
VTLSIGDVLARARKPEDSVTLCLRGDIVAEYEDLKRQLAGASEAVESLGDVSPAATIRQRMADLAGEMVSESVTFRLRAMPSKDWSDLFAVMPEPPKPAEGSEDIPDEAAAAFRDAWHNWVCTILAGTCYEPGMTTDEADQLAVALSKPQWDELTNAAYGLNTEKQTIPFSVAAFASPPATTPKSKRRTNSASRAASSSAES